jgi:hypothetical protein
MGAAGVIYGSLPLGVSSSQSYGYPGNDNPMQPASVVPGPPPPPSVFGQGLPSTAAGHGFSLVSPSGPPVASNLSNEATTPSTPYTPFTPPTPLPSFQSTGPTPSIAAPGFSGTQEGSSIMQPVLQQRLQTQIPTPSIPQPYAPPFPASASGPPVAEVQQAPVPPMMAAPTLARSSSQGSSFRRIEPGKWFDNLMF